VLLIPQQVGVQGMCCWDTGCAVINESPSAASAETSCQISSAHKNPAGTRPQGPGERHGAGAGGGHQPRHHAHPRHQLPQVGTGEGLRARPRGETGCLGATAGRDVDRSPAEPQQANRPGSSLQRSLMPHASRPSLVVETNAREQTPPNLPAPTASPSTCWTACSSSPPSPTPSASCASSWTSAARRRTWRRRTTQRSCSPKSGTRRACGTPYRWAGGTGGAPRAVGASGGARAFLGTLRADWRCGRH
jgi:hypothetical protein